MLPADKNIRENNGYWLLTLFFPIAILGKVIRWTILKATLADMSIGHGMAPAINSGNVHFAFMTGDATANANYIFSPLKFFGCISFEQYEIAISIIYNLLIFWIVYDFAKRNGGLSMFQFIVLAFFIGVLNVYTFTLAKEPAQMLYYFLMYPVLRSGLSSTRKWIVCLCIVVFMIACTRTYLVIMLMFAVAFKILFPWLYSHTRQNAVLSLALMFLVAGLIYFVFLSLIKVVSPVDYVELIRVRLRESEATTDIRAVIPSQTLPLFALNYLITSLRLLFPIEMIIFGPKYLLCAVFQVLVSCSTIYYTLNFHRVSATKQLVLCLFWGFLFCSASFEPDFGSWIRHESVVFPFLIYLFDNDDLSL